VSRWRSIERESELRVGMHLRADCPTCKKTHAFQLERKRPGGRHESTLSPGQGLMGPHPKGFGWVIRPYPKCVPEALWVGLSGGCGNGRLRVKGP